MTAVTAQASGLMTPAHCNLNLLLLILPTPAILTHTLAVEKHSFDLLELHEHIVSMLAHSPDEVRQLGQKPDEIIQRRRVNVTLPERDGALTDTYPGGEFVLG